MRKIQSLTTSALLTSLLSVLLPTLPTNADTFDFGFTAGGPFAVGPTVFGQIEGLSVGLNNQATSAVYITSVINSPAGFVSPFTPSDNLLNVSLPLSVAANSFSVNARGNISDANFVVNLGSSAVFVLSYTTANDLLVDFNSGIEIGPGTISFISNQSPPPPVVPSPIAGVGLPGLVFAGGLLAWWRRKRNVSATVASRLTKNSQCRKTAARRSLCLRSKQEKPGAARHASQ